MENNWLSPKEAQRLPSGVDGSALSLHCFQRGARWITQKIITVWSGPAQAGQTVSSRKGSARGNGQLRLASWVTGLSLSFDPRGRCGPGSWACGGFNATFEVTGGAHRMFQGALSIQRF